MSSNDLKVPSISPPRAGPTDGARHHGGRPLRSRGLRRQSLWVAAALWVAANCWVALTGGDALPFDWPARADRSVTGHLLDVNLALVQVLLSMGLVYLITRRRTPPDVAARAPDRALALRETLLLLGYGVLGLGGGFLLARVFGWHPFGLHLAGTIFGIHAHLEPAEVLTWAGYNLLVYAILPLIYFRRRYSTWALGLRSSDRRNDLLVIAVVLILEAAFQILLLEPEIITLPPGQLLPGAAVTFVLYLAGAVLPAMGLYLRDPRAALPQAHRLSDHHRAARRAHLRRPPHLGRLGRVQLPACSSPVPDLPDLHLSGTRHDQDLLDPAYGQRLGPRLGLPRLCPAHPHRHPPHRRDLQDPVMLAPTPITCPQGKPMSNRSLKALPQQSKAWWQAMKDQDLSVLQQQN
jgi:hypothetical protein